MQMHLLLVEVTFALHQVYQSLFWGFTSNHRDNKKQKARIVFPLVVKKCAYY